MLILAGQQGTGKSLVWEVLKRALGPKYVMTVTGTTYFAGAFNNSNEKHSLMINIEEMDKVILFSLKNIVFLQITKIIDMIVERCLLPYYSR